MIFKIYGERNSGTTFLTELLKKNFKNIKVEDNIHIKKNNKNYIHGWKHSIPSYNFKQNNKDVVDFIIFRDLNSWLVSMFKTPYHLCYDCPEKDFNRFLTKKQESENLNNTKWINIENNLPISIDDDNKTIFEIRYFKYLNTMKYFNEHKNIVLVNLTYIQNNDNCKVFINEIQKKFNLPISIPQLILKHTKQNTLEKNINHNIDITKYNTIIEKNKDETIEKEINDLTFVIKLE